MAALNNSAVLLICRAILAVCTKARVLGAERVPKQHKGLLLACTHLSYYDPMTISVLLRREVDWMAREEFFVRPSSAWLVRHAGGFSISRGGLALPGIRSALYRVRAGRVVGIFPEGEVVAASDSVLRGAPLKEGVGLLARHTGVPVVPCVVLNSDQFKRVGPWLPLRQGRLWIGFGFPVEPDMGRPPGRSSRREMTERVRSALLATYAELVETFDVPRDRRA